MGLLVVRRKIVGEVVVGVLEVVVDSAVEDLPNSVTGTVEGVVRRGLFVVVRRRTEGVVARTVVLLSSSQPAYGGAIR